MSEAYDEAKEDYYSLADEATAPEAHPWKDADWDERAVANAKKYAKRAGLPWPPNQGTFDMLYDRDHNPQDYPEL